MCPMAARFMPASDKQEAPAATCPLGFGTARGPKLSTLHCPVCKGLLFDAHNVVSCKHTFCKSCISQTQDCPSCGRDVDGLEPNSEMTGELYLGLSTATSCSCWHSAAPHVLMETKKC